MNHFHNSESINFYAKILNGEERKQNHKEIYFVTTDDSAKSVKFIHVAILRGASGFLPFIIIILQAYFVYIQLRDLKFSKRTI